MNHPPFGPDDLKDPPLSGDDFIKLLHDQRAERHPEPPPFYQALFDGSLKRAYVELWVKNMYAYWDDAMVTSTGGIFVKTNEEDVRSHILRKMVCIEGKEIVNDLMGWDTPAYEELWLRLGDGLGLRRQDVIDWKTFTRSHFAISTLCLASRWWEWTWLDGVASFYAGDQFGSEYLGRAADALKNHYGVADSSLEFFRAYVGDASEDLAWEREALAYWACTTERQLTAARAFRNRLDIEYQMVLPLQMASSGERMPLQVP
ncbi:MAG: pyrroloquinoline quinone biosynthesis protein PqqC [Chloroflexi bacterium]|nr:pyrroloquinoline quinone biosynthesis protein PqqC [Chloroflexota bacterium]